MADFLRDCNSGELKTDPKTFQETWCARCSQKGCSLARYAKTDLMAYRQATWQDRYFGRPQADLSVPKFAEIAQIEFPNLFQKALRLEISERRGDWSVSDVPIEDGVAQVASPEVQAHVEEAVRRYAATRSPHPEEVEETFDDPEEDDPGQGEDRPEVKKVTPPEERAEITEKSEGAPPVGSSSSNAQNAPDLGEVMIGGAPAPSHRSLPPEETDPWAPPARPKVTIVKPGARIQFGPQGPKVTDD